MRRLALPILITLAVLLSAVLSYSAIIEPLLGRGGDDDATDVEPIEIGRRGGARQPADPASLRREDSTDRGLSRAVGTDERDGSTAEDGMDVGRDASPVVASGTQLNPSARGEEARPPATVPNTSTSVPVVVRNRDTVRVGNQGTLAPDEEVQVPPGWAIIGSTEAWVEANDPGEPPISPLLRYEAPQHTVKLDTFRIERFEVTNQRWRTFLRQTSEVLVTTPVETERGRESRFYSILATGIWRDGLILEPRGTEEQIALRQFYESNRAVLHAALPQLLVKTSDGSIDEDATYGGFSKATLPDGLQLRFYDRPPPRHWKDMSFDPVEVDHPVRAIDPEAAIDFALWAGKHLPTEFEWEYACRGPKGLPYPWGSQGQALDEMVNGGRPLARDEEPATLPVRSLPEGASWVGCHHMLGNVSELTSSQRTPYPGSAITPPPQPRGVVGRGGSARASLPIIVRPPWRGTAVGDWGGLRLARYDEVGRSRIPNMHARMHRTGALQPGLLEDRIHASLVGEIEAIQDLGKEDTSALPGVKSFTVQPLRAVAFAADQTGTWAEDPETSIRDARDLLAAGKGSVPVLFGLVHTDVSLIDAWVARSETEVTSRTLRLDPALVPAGTYALGLQYERLVLVPREGPKGTRYRLTHLRPAHAYYLSRRPISAASVSLLNRKLPPDGTPRAFVSLDADAGARTLRIEFRVQLAPASLPNFTARVRFRIHPNPRVLELIPELQSGVGSR